MPNLRAGISGLIDWMPFGILVPLALVLLLAPFEPMPHVWEKMRLLAKGDLTRPLDVFDFLLHLLPTILVIVKTIHHFRR